MRPIEALALALIIASPAWASEHGGGGGGAPAAPVEAGPVEEVDPSLALKSAKQSSRDVKIPRALVARLEKEYREYLLHNQFPAQESLKRKLINVSVELRQKRAAALHEETRINTPIGGGVIDLADFLTPLRGAFQMKIKARSERDEQIPGIRVFYISRAKARVIDGEDFGAGCGKLVEVTKFLDKKMAKAGLELYTAGQRYLSVIGGTFVLAAFTREALQVGSVSFIDSRYPEVMCE